jgi:hypothetical protein
MPDDNQYGPDAYKRLALVKKQFQQNQAAQRKKLSAERRLRFNGWWARNHVTLVRYAVYAVLAAVVIAVLVVLVRR